MGFYKNTGSGAHSIKKDRIKDYVIKIISTLAHNRMEHVEIDATVNDDFVVTIFNKDLYDHSLEHLIIDAHNTKVRVDIGNDMVAGAYFMQNNYETVVGAVGTPPRYIFKVNPSVIDEIMK